jgi:hypothetical protein
VIANNVATGTSSKLTSKPEPHMMDTMTNMNMRVSNPEKDDVRSAPKKHEEINAQTAIIMTSTYALSRRDREIVITSEITPAYIRPGITVRAAVALKPLPRYVRGILRAIEGMRPHTAIPCASPISNPINSLVSESNAHMKI